FLASSHQEDPWSAHSDDLGILFLQLFVAVAILLFWGRVLFSSRLSRQILSGLSAAGLVSTFQSYVGYRLGVRGEAVIIMNAFWSSAILVTLGVSTERVFLWLAPLPAIAGGIALAMGDQGVPVVVASNWICAFTLIAAWARGRSRRPWKQIAG